MGYSMRFELALVCSLNGFKLVMGLYGGHSSLFLSVFTLACFTPHWSLIFDVLFVCMSGFRFHLLIFFFCVSVCLEIFFKW